MMRYLLKAGFSLRVLYKASRPCGYPYITNPGCMQWVVRTGIMLKLKNMGYNNAGFHAARYAMQ
jgi:hypothetical protein